MDEKQLNSPTPEEKRLLNLINSIEYCSIERAAELFNIKREDVEQFILSGSITCSLQLSAYVSPVQDLFVLDKLYEFFDELDPDIPPICWGEEAKGYLNELYGSPASRIGVIIDNENLDTMKFSLSGFWHLIPYNKQSLIDNIRNPQNSPLLSLVGAIPSSTYLPTQTQQERDPAELIAIDLSKITHQDIVISKLDLKVLYDALITGKTPLKSIFNDPQLAQELEKQQREANEKLETRGRPTKQFDLINALTKAITDTELLQEPKKCQEEVVAFLAKKGVANPIKDKATFKNWADKHKQQHSEKNKLIREKLEST